MYICIKMHKLTYFTYTIPRTYTHVHLSTQNIIKAKIIKTTY